MKKLLFLITLIIFHLGCGCEEKDTALADLIVQSCEYVLDLSNGNEFNVGETVDIAIQIVNLSNNAYECTATAAENDHQLCLYKKLPDGSFECVAKADYETLELEPNEAFDDKPNVVPNIPGEYYVSDFADINKIVPESNDDNNSTKEDQNVKFRSSQMASNRIIKVLPTLKYFEQLSKGVKIDYFEFKKKSNLKKVWVKSIN